MQRVMSSNGVEVALHDLDDRGSLPLLVCHATGFHGRCYRSVVAALPDGMHSWAVDMRGHGDTRLPASGDGAPAVQWSDFADDVLAAADALAGSGPMVVFGHSMGGAAALMAAHRRPDRFAGVVVYEPIVFPPGGIRPAEAGGSPLAAGARRRRASFSSYTEAIDNFASKRPLDRFTAEARSDYVHFGFEEHLDGSVHLKCRPETEAATFDAALQHATWDILPEVEVPVLVVSGAIAEHEPSAVAGAVATRLPTGRYLELDHLDHFGPMTHPEEIAAVIASFVVLVR